MTFPPGGRRGRARRGSKDVIEGHCAARQRDPALEGLRHLHSGAVKAAALTAALLWRRLSGQEDRVDY